MWARSFIGKVLLFALALVAVVVAGACAAFQPTDSNGPTANRPQYPLVLSDVNQRLEQASAAWYQLSQRYGLTGKTEANLDPFTATLASLPANLPAPLYLPKLGSTTNPTEDDFRESLRRFIVEWQTLIGADPNQLSLVERTDEPGGVKVARYEQKPFRYPLRGNFGSLVIRFRSDWQLVGLSSNCIPNADRLQGTLNSLTPKITAEQAVNHIKSQPVTIVNTNGQQQTVSLPANATATARQLVVYAQSSKDPAGGLTIRLAWEVEVKDGPVSTVYLDAISDEIIATT